MKVNVKLAILFLFCLGLAFANKVAKVEVMTSNCEDCGMGPFGFLSIRVHLFEYFYKKVCPLKKKKNRNFQIYGEFGDCLSDSLDNPLEDDVNEGRALKNLKKVFTQL